MTENCCRAELKVRNFLLGFSEPRKFVIFECGLPIPYLIWRIFWALYHVVWIILTGVYSWQWAGHDPAQQIKWFIYLTDWCYFMLTLSTLVDAICVVLVFLRRKDILNDWKKSSLSKQGSHTCNKEDSNHSFFLNYGSLSLSSASGQKDSDIKNEYGMEPSIDFTDGGECQVLPWYMQANWVLFNVANSSALLVSLLYWILIYGPDEDITAVNVETHALNSVYVIINVLVTAVPIRLYHFFHGVIYAVIYVFFTLVYYLAGGTNEKGKPYVYSTIDWRDTGYTVGLSIAVTFVAMPVVHLVFWALYKLRVFLFSKCLKISDSADISMNKVP